MAEEEIYLVPYNPLWPVKFEKEKQLIENTLHGYIIEGVQHVGSTAIFGIHAKPIIDIMVGVKSLEASKPCIQRLSTIGYHYYPYKPDIMHWFCKPSVEHREFHLYLMVPESPYWQERLLFRDYLRSHEEEKKTYEALKIHLAEQFRYDREAYTQAKTAFVVSIVKKARQDLSNSELK